MFFCACNNTRTIDHLCEARTGGTVPSALAVSRPARPGASTISEYWKSTPELPDASSYPVEPPAAVSFFAWGCFRYFGRAQPRPRKTEA